MKNKNKKLLPSTLSFLESGTVPKFLLGFLSTLWAW